MRALFQTCARRDLRGVRDFPKLMKEWPDRAIAVRNQLSYLAAKYVLKEILEKIPKKDIYKPYRMGLQVARVRGADSMDAVFAVWVDTHHRKIRKVDVPKVILFIKPSKKLGRIRPDVAALEKFNPWTYETIPFVPSKGDAQVLQRKVGRAEVERVTKARKRDTTKVRLALGRAGRREIRKRDKVKLDPKKVKRIPEVVFDALKMEFGLSAERARPHWRPAIRRLIRSGLRELRRSQPALTHAFTRSQFSNWRKWPTRTRRQIRMADVGLFRGFQKRLGIRV